VAALEPADADQALQATKDPYVFDFLELGEDAQERDLEQALIADIQKFLPELGTGFAFYGRQTPLLVGDQEFFLDLLFYHHALRRFVVIELKIGKFQPEFVSKMNFYLNAVDEQLRLGDDRESAGIILCADRDETRREARAAPRVRPDRRLYLESRHATAGATSRRDHRRCPRGPRRPIRTRHRPNPIDRAS
jgi:YhcG PDDEXK nuclease domain